MGHNTAGFPGAIKARETDILAAGLAYQGGQLSLAFIRKVLR
jgi:hypothetical protein